MNHSKTLADHIREACNTMYDLMGIASMTSEVIGKAQRFEMSDDIMRACYNLLDTKPSTMNAALPLCRLPYPLMWCEYHGGLGPPNRRGEVAPVPERQGFLIEHFTDYPEASQTGQALVCWMHGERARSGHTDAINISPFAIYFDFRPDGDVAAMVRACHAKLLAFYAEKATDARGRQRHGILATVMGEIEQYYFANSDEAEVKRFFMNRHGWQQFANSPREIEAMRMAEKHMMFGLSPYGTPLLTEVLRLDNCGPESRALVANWMADIQGEGMILQCLLCMLNSRNVVQHEVVDLSRLNKARRKRGKSALYDYTRTTISLTRAMHRVSQARGIDRETARQHLVRGHFKIRRTGVYWWSPFVRGDAKKGEIRREEYEVT